MNRHQQAQVSMGLLLKSEISEVELLCYFFFGLTYNTRLWPTIS